MGLPPVVVGLVVTLLLWRTGPFGELRLLYTPSAMVLAQLIVALPIVAGFTRAALDLLDPDLVLALRAGWGGRRPHRIRARAGRGGAPDCGGRRRFWASHQRGRGEPDGGWQHCRPDPDSDHRDHAGNGPRRVRAGDRPRNRLIAAGAHGQRGTRAGLGERNDTPLTRRKRA